MQRFKGIWRASSREMRVEMVERMSNQIRIGRVVPIMVK